ncbi:MAG: LVIVD repeat-containing protein, partial [Candidatus Thorarchaeota archaeon]
VDRLNPFNPELNYQWDVKEKITFVEIYGEYIYLGCESRGLQILEFTEYITPQQIYKFSPNINARNVILDCDKVYLCAIKDGSYDGGLFVFNITNSHDPQPLGNFSLPGYNFYDVEIKDEICFAAAYDNGLISLNISDPANIYIIDSIGGFLLGGYYELNYSQNIEIFDDIAFVANGLVGLDIYNISDPFNLEHITNYPGDLSSVGVYSDIKIRNDYAFIAKGYEGVEVFNISNLNNIQSIANYSDSYNNSQALEFWGNYLLVADRFDGLEIIDISNISNPQKISQYTDVYNRATKVQIIDNLAIVSDRADGIEIINISNPMNPVEVSSYSDSYNNSLGCVATSRFLYIADGYDGFQIAQYKEHLFNQYEKSAIAQSLEIDKTIASITNATMIINGEIPDNTTIQSFLSNDNGNNWEMVSNNTLHTFGTIGSGLIWKMILSTTNDLVTPKIFEIVITYSAINTPPIILNPSELQNLTIWNQPEDFGFFEINLSEYKDDNEFSDEYLSWSIINLDSTLVSVVQDDLNKDIFRFYSVDDAYGNDEFDLLLHDEGGANVSLNITLSIYSVNDAPRFLENSINIQQEKDFIQIEYEAEDIDNLSSDLNYSIYYGSMDSWHSIIENYKNTTYTWYITEIPRGNYYIKIIVCDGLANDTWISTELFSIGRPIESPFIPIIILTSSIAAGIGLGVLGIFYIRAKKRKQRIPYNQTF